MGEGVKKSQNFADVICGWSPKCTKPEGCKRPWKQFWLGLAVTAVVAFAVTTVLVPAASPLVPLFLGLSAVLVCLSGALLEDAIHNS